jgi:hypothetical protein
MRTLFWLVLFGAVFGCLGTSPWAVEPVAMPRDRGTVLVLDNGRTFEGEIERQGNQYRIRRGTAETWLPAERGMRLCSDWQEAYIFMMAHANLLDPEERVRLAHWCLLHNLREQALTEVNAADKLCPNHKEICLLRDRLQRTVADVVTPVNAQVKTPAGPPPLLDVSSESVALFTTRVQPILMNTCVSCHTAGRGGNFQLFRAFEGGMKATTRKNLAAVLAQINTDQPNLSPFLIKAVSAHGNGVSQPPLRSRQIVPYRMLEDWVTYVLATNPHLGKHAPSAPAIAAPQPRAVPRVPTLTPQGPGAEPRSVPSYTAPKDGSVQTTEPRPFVAYSQATVPVGPRPLAPPPVAGADPKLSPAAPAAAQDRASLPPITVPSPLPTPSAPSAAEPADPFDPVIFNRERP